MRSLGLFFGTLLIVIAAVFGYLGSLSGFEMLFSHGRAPILTGLLALYGVGTIVFAAIGWWLYTVCYVRVSNETQHVAIGSALFVSGLVLVTLFCYLTSDVTAMIAGLLFITVGTMQWCVGFEFLDPKRTM